MPRYLLLAQSEVTANALNAWLELLGERPLDGSDDPRCIVWNRPAGRERALDGYETLVRRVEAAARDGDDRVPLNQVVALVDAVRPSGLSAVDESGSWDNLIAMLILTFPEIRWVFGVTSGEDKASCWSRTIEPHHDLASLLKPTRRDPLFDPSGLRQWVRAYTNDGLNTAGDDLELPVRQTIAAAIDEEKSYAYLHGYTAYRFGSRADVVTTWSLMKERFGKGASERESKSKAEPHGYWLLLEDMSLNFPDREGGRMHLLRLAEREEWMEGGLNSADCNIENSDYRILVTTGQARAGDTALAENRAYLRAKAYGKGKVVFKPASGMFDLWEKAELFRSWPGSRRKGNAPGFLWPPDLPTASGEATGHGAPGKLMLVAEMLIQRTETLAGNVTTVGGAVHGAVLAADALELTGGRTPTIAIQALSLKHRFEVMAECQFCGVEYHIKIKPRLDEIAVETAAITRWFHRSQQTNARLNGEMVVFNGLVGVLRGYDQYDEEQVCMNRVRRLHNTLWVRQHPSRFILLPLLRYLEILLSSFAVFVAVLVFWVIGLSMLFWLTNTHIGADWGHGLSDAVSAFFSVGSPVEHAMKPQSAGWSYLFVACLAIVSGFIHLGVFISHLYSIASRK